MTNGDPGPDIDQSKTSKQFDNKKRIEKINKSKNSTQKHQTKTTYEPKIKK